MKHPSGFVVPVCKKFILQASADLEGMVFFLKMGFMRSGDVFIQTLCNQFEHHHGYLGNFYRDDFVGLLRSCSSGLEFSLAVGCETDSECDFVDPELRLDFVSACLSFLESNQGLVRSHTFPRHQVFFDQFFAQLPELMKQLGCRPQTSFVVVDELPPRTWTGLEVELYG